MRNEEKSSFILYKDYWNHIKLLSIEQRGILLSAIMLYVVGEELPEMDGMTQMAFSFIKEQMDRDAEKFRSTVEKRREAGKLGGRPAKANAIDEKTKKANGFSEKQTKAKKPDNDTVTDTVTDIKKESKEKSQGFSPPTRQDVAEYCRENGYGNVDIERFIDFYSSKGWMVGKNKMKDWKAAVRNWARSEQATKPNNTKGNKFSNFSQSQYDYDQLESELLNTQPGG